MSAESGNAARQLPEAEIVEEPSMEEILSSIKQIIAEDELTDGAPAARENFEYPDNPSNSNRTKVAFAEDELQAALQAELEGVSTGDKSVHDEPQVGVPARARGRLSREELEVKAAAVRKELAATGAGLTSDERIQQYRQRNRLKVEALAEERAKLASASSIPTQPPVQVAPPPTISSSAPVTPAPAVAAPGTVAAAPATFIAAPDSATVVRQMAEIMMKEKSGEIESMLTELMRPTIRQWLNDNLPSMVQRLVREEIQAASRGRKTT